MLSIQDFSKLDVSFLENSDYFITPNHDSSGNFYISYLIWDFAGDQMYNYCIMHGHKQCRN